MIVKRVGIVSVAKIYGAISLAFGLFFGICLALASMVGVGLSGGEHPASLGAMLGAGAVVALPIFYGVMGFIGGAIGAALYNIFAGMVGGVRIEVE